MNEKVMKAAETILAWPDDGVPYLVGGPDIDVTVTDLKVLARDYLKRFRCRCGHFAHGGACPVCGCTAWNTL